MKRNKLIKILKEIVLRQKEWSDVESDHSDADEALLEFIGDITITRIYNKIKKWYA